LKVKLYIPNPRRCFKCQEYGHGAMHCKKIEICANCSEVQHDPKPDVCNKPKKCKNCLGEHPSWNRKCPIYLKEYEIQRIQTTSKISNYQARQRFNELNTPLSKQITYSDAMKHSPNNPINNQVNQESTLIKNVNQFNQESTLTKNVSPTPTIINIDSQELQNKYKDNVYTPTTITNNITSTEINLQSSLLQTTQNKRTSDPQINTNSKQIYNNQITNEMNIDNFS
jgi:hypothetical protein